MIVIIKFEIACRAIKFNELNLYYPALSKLEYIKGVCVLSRQCCQFLFCFIFSLPWHCKNNCYFDLCFGCTRSTRSTAHDHPLLKTNPKSLYQSGGWMCDICSTLFKNEDPEKPYSCRECSFDLCLQCLKGNPPKRYSIQLVQVTILLQLQILTKLVTKNRS